MGYCSKCQYHHPVEENKYRCPYDHMSLRTSPRKKKNKNALNPFFLKVG
jgi:hypothetical protein